MAFVANIPREELLSGLASLQNITAKRGTIAILSNVLLTSQGDSIVLTGTDLEIGLRIAVPAPCPA